MTQSTRTVAQIEAAIAGLNTVIDGIDEFCHKLRNEPAHADDYVIGYPGYGWYVNSQDKLGGVLWARFFSAHAAARFPTVRNGKGEVAVIVSYESALDQALNQQLDQHTFMCGMLQDAYEELAIAKQIEADEAEAAALDAAADEAAYYDSFDWHQYDDLDDCYEQRRDAKAERDADARQDR